MDLPKQNIYQSLGLEDPLSFIISNHISVVCLLTYLLLR